MQVFTLYICCFSFFQSASSTEGVVLHHLLTGGIVQAFRSAEFTDASYEMDIRKLVDTVTALLDNFSLGNIQ